jgi:hypothetical protein
MRTDPPALRSEPDVVDEKRRPDPAENRGPVRVPDVHRGDPGRFRAQGDPEQASAAIDGEVPCRASDSHAAGKCAADDIEHRDRPRARVADGREPASR